MLQHYQTSFQLRQSTCMLKLDFCNKNHYNCWHCKLRQCTVFYHALPFAGLQMLESIEIR